MYEKFHAVEWTTDWGYGVFVSRSEAERDTVLKFIRPDSDAHSIGEVDAKDETEAAKKVAEGKWSYSHYA